MAVNNEVFAQIHPNTPTANKDALINENFRKLSDAFNPLIISNGKSNSIIIGKNKGGEYGIYYYDDDGNVVATITGDRTVYYDDNKTPRILIGKAPDNNRIGIWVSKPNIDVVSELEG